MYYLQDISRFRYIFQQFGYCVQWLKVAISKGSNQLGGCFFPFHLKTEAQLAFKTLYPNKNQFSRQSQNKKTDMSFRFFQNNWFIFLLVWNTVTSWRIFFYHYFVQWTNRCTSNWQIVTLLPHVSTLMCATWQCTYIHTYIHTYIP